VLSLSLDFYISDEALSYLENAASDLCIFAVVTYTNPDPSDPILSFEGERVLLRMTGDTVVDGQEHRVYTLNLGISEVADYDKQFAARAFVSYKLLGKEHTVGSDFGEKNIINPYTAAYNAFCDRSEEKSERYPYQAADGSYSPIADLTALKRIIASTLYLKVDNGKAKDVMDNGIYTSIYDIDYFDGVLTVSVEGGDVTDWLTSKLVVNGEERYFEIYEGRIRLIL